MYQCDDCGRNFNAKALQVHRRICAKVFGQKRKTFKVQIAPPEALQAAAAGYKNYLLL